VSEGDTRIIAPNQYTIYTNPRKSSEKNSLVTPPESIASSPMNLTETLILRSSSSMHSNVLVTISFLVISIKVNCSFGKPFKVCSNASSKDFGGTYLMDCTAS